MSSGSPLHISSSSTLEFKSSSFDVPALVLGSNKITVIKKELQEKISQAPDFFKHSPIVIDIHELTEQQLNIDIRTLVQTLRDLKFFPIGMQGGSDKQHKIAVDSGVPILSIRLLESLKEDVEPAESEVDKPSETSETEELVEEIEVAKTEVEKVSATESMLIMTPVRSGQRIYSKGDLIILAQVSSGAEVLAEGSIHVYAPLRGRALAGVQGNTESRIFCSNLQAELISIAGNYRIKDDIKEDTSNKSVQVFLQENALIIEEL